MASAGIYCAVRRSRVPCPRRRRPSSTAAFREFGLPETIRTDNGAPFSTLAPGGLSRLAVWWIRLGIRPERILPGRPDQNGRHERMHSTLKAETARPPRSSLRAQQRCFETFRREYNHERPHEALAYETPASQICGLASAPILASSRTRVSRRIFEWSGRIRMASSPCVTHSGI